MQLYHEYFLNNVMVVTETLSSYYWCLGTNFFFLYKILIHFTAAKVISILNSSNNYYKITKPAFVT